MADIRNPESRIARLEACFARLDEQIKAIAQNRAEWKIEISRRLDENNENAKKLMEERAKDRAELVTQDLYASRHSELKSELESHVREITAREMEHERDDLRRHETDGTRLKLLEEFKANMQGRMLAVGAIAAALATLAQLIIHAVTK